MICLISASEMPSRRFSSEIRAGRRMRGARGAGRAERLIHTRGHAQVHHQRQMVGGTPLLPSAGHLGAERFDALTQEDMVEPQQRPARREGRARAALARRQGQYRIRQALPQPCMRARTRHRVEVAQQHHRLPQACGMAEPCLAKQGADLGGTFRGEKAEMRVEHLQLQLIGQLNRHPERAARLQERPVRQAGQRRRLHQPHGQRRQDRVAVMLLLDGEGRVEMDGHAEVTRDQLRLVHAARPAALHVKLLQADDIRRAARDHLRDAARIGASVRADAAMHVIGDDA